MAKHPLWHGEYRLLLMQLYLKRPQGVKPLYSRACLIHSTPHEISNVMEVYRACDPYLNHDASALNHEEPAPSPLLTPCMQVWKCFGNGDPKKLTVMAAQLRDYWK